MSMPSFDAKAFVLSEKESTRIFEQQIIPADFSGFLEKDAVKPSPLPSPPLSCGWRRNPPVAVLIVGQTGAGKTHAAPAIKEVFESIVRGKSGQRHNKQRREGAGDPSPSKETEGHEEEEEEGPVIAHFVADTYKTYHPAYAALSAGDANAQTGRASAATGPDARLWLAMAVRRAVALRLDVLLESACRHPEDFADLAQTFHEGGYRVEVALMAVPAGLSRLGILTRFYRRRTPEEGESTSPSSQRGSLSLAGRLTPKKVHDDSYEGLLHAAEFIDESDAVDQVVLVRRDNLVVYADERSEDGAWKQQTLGGQVEWAERQRP
ncbi:Toxin zeta [Apiospora arundinis]